MQPDATDTASRNRSARATRERILEATNRLFYEQGMRATSADRIIEDVGITKVTFYRHFHSKNDLVVAYLTQQAVLWRRACRSKHDVIGNLVIGGIAFLWQNARNKLTFGGNHI